MNLNLNLRKEKERVERTIKEKELLIYEMKEQLAVQSCSTRQNLSSKASNLKDNKKDFNTHKNIKEDSGNDSEGSDANHDCDKVLLEQDTEYQFSYWSFYI